MLTDGGGVPDQIQCLDVLGRTIRSVTEGFGLQADVYVDQYYDDSGRVERVSEPYLDGDLPYWNLTTYDEIGRPLEQMLTTNTGTVLRDHQFNAQEQLYSYDVNATGFCGQSAGPRTTIVTNGKGQGRLEKFNALGETTDVYDDNCGHVSYAYDATGNLRQVTGADNEVVTMSYDVAGRKTAMSDPDKGDWQYAYNALGEMTRQLDSLNQAVDFEYDALGRVILRSELADVGSLTDTNVTTVNREETHYRTVSPGKSQPQSITYYLSTTATRLHRRDFIYDAFGRVDVVSTTIDGTDQFAEQTTYDQFGRVFQQFDASGGSRGVRYHYDNSGYLLSLQEAREGTSGVDYQMVGAMDARGNVTELTLGNNVKVSASYDAGSGRLSQIQAVDLSTNGS